ncbi:hypothetical protein EYF80_013440 [Liparis tanakae]|uniref:Uncharacterized protein n=1 Tax=Liparis tanakae TaxID=230148 RepID=A0A4Z2IF23_9TELE|nr:hypothetical protein EYF80_013440 [Liparis tanakae]
MPREDVRLFALLHRDTALTIQWRGAKNEQMKGGATMTFWEYADLASGRELEEKIEKISLSSVRSERVNGGVFRLTGRGLPFDGSERLGRSSVS